MTRDIYCIAVEFILELSEATPEDFLQMKLMMLSSAKHIRVKSFLQAVFELAEERRPLLIEKK